MAPTTELGSRRIERSALTALVPVVALVPFWLLALAVVWLPFRLAAGVPYWIMPLAWLLLGVLLFVPAVQVAIIAPLLRARRPSDDELAVITPVWRDLAASANLPQYLYRVRVIDSDELNAFACGGHLVIVTSFAVESLSERELSGVLAHELSHHLGLHTAALTLGHWLSLPVVLLARVGFYLQNVATAATDSFAAHSAALTALGRVAAGLLRAISWVFLAALYASDALANLVGQSSEFEADRRAVRMGYGAALADALRTVIRYGGGARPIGWKARLASSHPPALTRVARIEAMMRHPSR
ncbi:MAG: M48 family metalloprotease [Ilumatobacter sp.]|uniref:M48 family metalloprotease n=1 Tax=Ilumatobacter sp. TaxID=1967498 RepID=UPI0026328B2F|nr:M48 family metalloprotease [Ilumatobacter sp.]MDJ0769164.1 M48 family metalloprotease [Ilumatobacter sp.]